MASLGRVLIWLLRRRCAPMESSRRLDATTVGSALRADSFRAGGSTLQL